MNLLVTNGALSTTLRLDAAEVEMLQAGLVLLAWSGGSYGQMYDPTALEQLDRKLYLMLAD